MKIPVQLPVDTYRGGRFDSCGARSVIEDTLIDIVFETIDDMLLRGEFDGVNEILRQADPSRMYLSTAIGYATITCAAREQLPEYDAYIARVRVTIDDPKRLKPLLDGLE